MPVNRRSLAGIVKRVGGEQRVGDVGLAVEAGVRKHQRAALALFNRDGLGRHAQAWLDVRPLPAERFCLVAGLQQLDIGALRPELHEVERLGVLRERGARILMRHLNGHGVLPYVFMNSMSHHTIRNVKQGHCNSRGKRRTR